MFTGSLGLGDSFPCHLHSNLHAIRSGEYNCLFLLATKVQCNARNLQSSVNCISKEWSGACLSSQAFLPNVLIMPSVTDVALKAICGTNKYKLHHKYKKFKQQNYNLKNKNRARFHLSSQAFLLNEPGYSDKNTEPYGSDPIVIIDLLGEQFVFCW